jgi:hypothetical protein
MLDRDLTCAQYRQRWRGAGLSSFSRTTLRPMVTPDRRRDGTDRGRRLVIVTEAANSLPPRRLAMPLMKMASVLSPNGIRPRCSALRSYRLLRSKSLPTTRTSRRRTGGR